jgi:hypothetical protein
VRLPRPRLWGFYLPLGLAVALAAWFVADQLPRPPSRTRLMALVVTSSQELPRRGAVWKQDAANDAQGYVELLTAANIPFEMMWMERFEIPLRYLVEGDLRKYSTIILATPARNLTDRSVETVLLASRRFGISLLAAGDAVDARLRLAFGIRDLRPDADPARRVRALRGTRVERTAEGAPRELVSRFGRAMNYYFDVAGRGYLDGYGAAPPAVREAIRTNSGYGMVSASLSGVAVLRMDDALFNGSSFQQDRRWPGGLYARMDEAAWERVRAVLARHGARMSLGVVTGYLDDGDPKRGTLYRRGRVVDGRRCGTVYDSREMRYVDRHGPRPGRRYDYESEYRGVLGGVREGVLDAEVHGWFHVSPDLADWCTAADRETNLEWLMELAPRRGRPATADDQRRVLAEGSRRVAEWFGAGPSTLIPPAHGVDEQSELVARDGGLQAVDGPFLSLLRPDRVIQNGKIKTFWAHWGGDGVTASPLKAGYPFAIGLHDRELVRRGAAWFDAFLARWRAEGVSRFITLRELVAHLGTGLTASLEGDAVTIAVDAAPLAAAGLPAAPSTGEPPLSLELRLPTGRRVAAVRLDGAPWRDYAIDGGRVVIRMPARAGERRTLRIDLGREAGHAA